MKKFSHFLVAILGGGMALFLAWLFIQFYIVFGSELNEQNTLFKTLMGLDYKGIGVVFVFVLIYMIILDMIVVIVIRSLKRVIKDKRSEKSGNWFSRYWFKYRSIHILFILLTLFITLSITAPSAIMNSFTAIVSISVLVSNLTKKIGKEEDKS